MDNKDSFDDKMEEAWNSPYASVPEEMVNKSWDEFSSHRRLRGSKPAKSTGWVTLAAAAILLLLGISYFYLEFHNPTITHKNLSLVEKEITLPDGSQVVLKQGAHLQYKKYFRNSRHVQLKGTAYFDVVRDSLREFTVGTGSSMIRVLGTSFSVTSSSNNQLEVALFTGRVSISVAHTAESYGLIPGEKFYLSQGRAQIKNFDPHLSFERNNQFIDIDEMSTDRFLTFLEDRFGYRFIPDSLPLTEWVTLRIHKDDKLEEILEILTTINNIEYEIDEVKKTIVLLQGLK